MAFLNVSQEPLDPMFADKFSVNRRVEALDIHGRSVLTPMVIPNVIGTVVPITPNNLDRHDGYQLAQRSIKVITSFQLQGEVTGSQPDIVVWRGDNFVVKHIDYYPQFGNGLIEAECVSVDRTDAVLSYPAPGAFVYNKAVNSSFIVVR